LFIFHYFSILGISYFQVYKKLLGFFLRLSIGLMMIQSGILVAKEMVGHANLVPNLVSLSTYIISLGGRPFHPSVPSSVHPSSSSRKKKMMEREEDDDSWRRQQFIHMFM
jgi:hypothetical protein